MRGEFLTLAKFCLTSIRVVTYKSHSSHNWVSELSVNVCFIFHLCNFICMNTHKCAKSWVNVPMFDLSLGYQAMRS